MRRLVISSAVAPVAILTTGGAHPSGRASLEQGKAFALRAADLLRSEGPDTASAHFEDKGGTYLWPESM